VYAQLSYTDVKNLSIATTVKNTLQLLKISRSCHFSKTCYLWTTVHKNRLMTVLHYQL